MGSFFYESSPPPLPPPRPPPPRRGSTSCRITYNIPGHTPYCGQRTYYKALTCNCSVSVVVVQYVFLGPRAKIIILNILSESKRLELKFSLKTAFMCFGIILKWQVPNLNIFSCNSKKGDRARGPSPRIWSLVHESCIRRMKILTIFYLFFLILDISKL